MTINLKALLTLGAQGTIGVLGTIRALMMFCKTTQVNFFKFVPK